MANLKAKYQVRGPKIEMVTYNQCSLDPETKSLQQKEVTEEFETFMVYFPQGHSIRVVGRQKLEELGYHLKPRIVDMDTGDVVQRGGDPFDFANNEADEVDQLSLIDEE